MKLLKKLALTAAATLLATADSHATPRRPLIRRANVSPAPARVAFAAPLPPPLTLPGLPAGPQRIAPPAVPVPVIPPTGPVPVSYQPAPAPGPVPAVSLLTLPARVVQAVGGCIGGVCPRQ